MFQRQRIAIAAAMLLTVAAGWFGLGSKKQLPVVRAQVASGGPIHGYVGAVLQPQLEIRARASLGFGSIVSVPDITVSAKNLKTNVSSPPIKTNPEGYFQTDTLAPGIYQVCVSGPGYTSTCDPQRIEIVNSIHVMNHVIEIQSATSAIAGTVRLADGFTPCFWFRPAFDTHKVIAAQVSLLDASNNVIAGPVNGNSVGQYVLPVAVTSGAKLQAVCENQTASPAVKFGGGTLFQDIVIANSPPQIVSFDLTKGGVGVRRADPGDTLHAMVTVTDPDGDTLHYRWVDDSGRTLGLPDSPSVDWPLVSVTALNTLRVQVSDGKGGFAVSQASVRAGPNQIMFEGTLVDRQTISPINNADVTLNNVTVKSNAAGHFQVSVPDAQQFVLNVNKPGIALVSRVFRGRATGLQIPVDATQISTVNGKNGGTVVPPGCDCACGKHGDKDDDEDRDRDHDRDRDRDRDRSHDRDDRYHRDRDHDHDKHCKPPAAHLTFKFEPNALVDKHGNAFAGTATVEMFQYNTSLPNPIPGDQGATSGGKQVRLTTFGAFYITARDSTGNALQVAPAKKVNVTMPIEPTLLAKAPATVPFLRYDESTGLWTEIGTMTRSGNNYVATVNHFSAFNADTIFPGGACVKVILDPASFTLPVALDASYVDPQNGQFNHNGTQATDNPVGIERMVPNVNFTLEVHDVNTNTLLKSVTLNSGPGLDKVQFPDGLDTDQVNFSHCNGPVTVYSGAVPTGPTYLEHPTGGVIQDNSAAYKGATVDVKRDTLAHWLSTNGFTTGEPQAIYFNNGDLKFGRDMHCRVTSSGTTACYVKNYGNVGQDDSPNALLDARNANNLQATVAMEYDPAAANGENVQFWAYDSGGNYLPKPTLDGQGAKPIPDMCLACHGGYFTNITNKVKGASFLPFDLDSFIYDAQGDPHPGSPNQNTVQEQFRQLNNIVLNTSPADPSAYTQLLNLWYGTNQVVVAGSQFKFGQGAAQLSGTPFSGHELLYDSVVSKVCRTCHIARSSGDDWTSFTQMSGPSVTIQFYACGTANPSTHSTVNFAMPHAEVPLKRFWQNSLSSTLESELSLPSPGCPNN